MTSPCSRRGRRQSSPDSSGRHTGGATSAFDTVTVGAASRFGLVVAVRLLGRRDPVENLVAAIATKLTPEGAPSRRCAVDLLDNVGPTMEDDFVGGGRHGGISEAVTVGAMPNAARLRGCSTTRALAHDWYDTGGWHNQTLDGALDSRTRTPHWAPS